MKNLHATPTAHHTKKSMFVHDDFHTCSHVLLRQDSVRRPLKPPHSGPHEVVDRINDHVFIIKVKGKKINVSIERLKPAYTTNRARKETTVLPTKSLRTYPAKKKVEFVTQSLGGEYCGSTGLYTLARLASHSTAANQRRDTRRANERQPTGKTDPSPSPSELWR